MTYDNLVISLFGFKGRTLVLNPIVSVPGHCLYLLPFMNHCPGAIYMNIYKMMQNKIFVNHCSTRAFF